MRVSELRVLEILLQRTVGVWVHDRLDLDRQGVVMVL